MFARFRVGNFLSFSDIQTVSLLSENFDKDNTHAIKCGNNKFLNSLFMFGPNAAGKSNLIKAIIYSKNFIIRGPKIKHYRWEVEESRPLPFLYNNGTFLKKPSYFEYQIEINGTIYSYGYEIKYNSEELVSEWLYEIKPEENVCIFEIDYTNNKIETKDEIIEPFDVKNYSSDNFLYMTRLSRFSTFVKSRSANVEKSDTVKILEKIYDWIKNRLIVHTSKLLDEYFPVSEDILSELSAELYNFDTGITGICEEEFRINPSIPVNLTKKMNLKDNDYLVLIPGNKNKRSWFLHITGDSKHRKYTELKFYHDDSSNNSIDARHKYRIDEESLGTYRIIQILSLIKSISYLSKTNPEKMDYALIFDEFECSLHTAATLDLIKYYHSANLSNTQLLVTTHEYRIMESKTAGREEIWFIDSKHDNESKSTVLYSLRSFKELDRDYGSYYLNGRYSAIPNFGEFYFE